MGPPNWTPPLDQLAPPRRLQLVGWEHYCPFCVYLLCVCVCVWFGSLRARLLCENLNNNTNSNNNDAAEAQVKLGASRGAGERSHWLYWFRLC